MLTWRLENKATIDEDIDPCRDQRRLKAVGKEISHFGLCHQAGDRVLVVLFAMNFVLFTLLCNMVELQELP